MRSIYLIIFFIAATVLFFYTVNSFTLTVNLPPATATSASSGQPAAKPAAPATNGAKTFTPTNFIGPAIQPPERTGPGIIGPKTNPPNY